MKTLKIYNSHTGEKEIFKPLVADHVGLYVCGPTVYSYAHLGNCRTFTSFDIIYRFLKAIGYKVRYVRNITDVGHLLDDGEDRISKGARLLNLEPMEVVQKYTIDFHEMMAKVNALPPSIEPRATAHIIEQIEMIKEILEAGFAYEINGSIYFDVLKYQEDNKSYGEVSGRIIDDLVSNTRDDLKNQEEKRSSLDFALWIKASEDHIMRWPSPWSVGFPGWHLECSAMSRKYLGNEFDIHGGGNDLKFPHHENEVAQNKASCGCAGPKYWMHTNMLLLNGKKMSKSEGSTISPKELFSGTSPLISRAFSPAVFRFAILQSHYRNTMDLTENGLEMAEKGLKKMLLLDNHITSLEASKNLTDENESINTLLDEVENDMLDDFNTPRALSRLYEIVTIVNTIRSRKESGISEETLIRLQHDVPYWLYDVFGLPQVAVSGGADKALSHAMELIIDIRAQARADKNWGLSDQIRDKLSEAKISIKDGKEQTEWTLES